MDRTEYLHHIDQRSMEIRNEFAALGVDLTEPAQQKAADISVLWVMKGLQFGLEHAENKGYDPGEASEYAVALVAEALPFFGAAIGKNVEALIDAGFESRLLNDEPPAPSAESEPETDGE